MRVKKKQSATVAMWLLVWLWVLYCAGRPSGFGMKRTEKKKAVIPDFAVNEGKGEGVGGCGYQPVWQWVLYCTGRPSGFDMEEDRKKESCKRNTAAVLHYRTTV